MRGVIIPEEKLRQYKADKVSDEEIAAQYGVNRRTIGRLREKYAIDAMTRSEAAKAYQERNQPTHCQNPKCGRKATHYKLGLCNACYDHQRTHNGEQRTPQRGWTRNKGQWCIRCKERRAYCQKKCTACYFYEKKNGKPRERYRWQDACTVCGKPREYAKYIKGRCKQCYGHWFRTGVDKTPEQIAAVVPFGWCDCGQKATHKDVPLQVMTVDKGVEYEELYNLCDDCWGAEFGEALPPTKLDKLQR
jgi:hypothetical protein